MTVSQVQSENVKAVSSKWQLVSRVSGALLLVLIAYILLANFLPFAPYRINFYLAEPSEGCPSTATILTVNDGLTHTWWASAGRYELDTYWREVGTPFRTDVEEFKGDFTNVTSYESVTHISPVERTAPGEAGEWRVATDMTIYGTVLGFPRQDEYHFMSDKKVFETLPATDPSCLMVGP